MFKVEIKMNEDKILREKEYSLTKIYSVIDNLFSSYNLPKIAKGVYTNNNNSSDYAHMWRNILDLLKTDWFMENAESVFWFNSDGRSSENDFSVENVLEGYKKIKQGEAV